MRCSILIIITLLVAACASPPGPVFEGVYPPPDGWARIYVFASGYVEGTASRKILYNRHWAGTITARTDPGSGQLSCQFLDLVVKPGRIDIQYLEWGFSRATHSEIRQFAKSTARALNPHDIGPIGTSFVAQAGSVLFVEAELHLTKHEGTTEEMSLSSPKNAVPLIKNCARSTDLPESPKFPG